MALRDSAQNVTLNFKAQVAEISRAENKVEELADAMENIAASAVAANEAQDGLNREFMETAGAASTASTSLSAYQAQVAASAAASEALSNDIDDIGDALNNMDDKVGDVAVQQLADSLEDVDFSDIDVDSGLDNFTEWLDDFDQDKLQSLLQSLREGDGIDIADTSNIEMTKEELVSLDNLMGDINRKTSELEFDAFSKTSKEIDADVEDVFTNLSLAGNSEKELMAVRDLFKEAFEERDDINTLSDVIGLENTELRELMFDAGGGKEPPKGFKGRKKIRGETLAELGDMGVGRLVDIKENRLSSTKFDEIKGAEKRDLIGHRLLSSLSQREGINNVSDIIRMPGGEIQDKIDEMKNVGAIPDDSKYNAAFLKKEILRKLVEVNSGSDSQRRQFMSKVNSLFEDSGTFDMEATEDLSEFPQVGETREVSRSDPKQVRRMIMEAAQHSGAIDMSEGLSSDSERSVDMDSIMRGDTSALEVPGEFSSFQEAAEAADIDDSIKQDIIKLGKFADKYDEAANILRRSHSPADAVGNLTRAFRDELTDINTEEILGNYEAELNKLFGDVVDSDDIDVGAASQEELIEHIVGSMDREGGLAGIQEEMLADIVPDLDSRMLQGESGGRKVPITDAALRMQILQRMMDAEEGKPTFAAARGLLEEMELGNIQTAGTYFKTERGRTDMISTLENALPDDLAEGDLAENIVDSFAETGDPLADFIGDNAAEDILDPVSKAVDESDVDIDSRRTRLLSGDVVQEVLRAEMAGVGMRSGAVGITTTAGMTETKGLMDLMPRNMEDFDMEEEVLKIQQQQDIGEDEARRKAVRRFTNKLTDQELGFFEHIQDRAPALLGADMSKFANMPVSKHLFSEKDKFRRKRRGLATVAMRSFDALSAKMPTRGSGRTTGTDVQRRLGRLRKINKQYKKLIPALEASSLGLGPLNVQFETLGIMIFKLTTTLGPLITSLFGLVGALGAATVAAGSFIAVGIYDFLGRLEEQMAGASSRMEAAKELFGEWKDAAELAIEPIASAELGGGGAKPFELFQSALTGSLRLLRRFSEGVAEIMEMDVVGEQLGRLFSLFSGSGDGSFTEYMKETLKELLPILVNIIIAFANWFGPALAAASEIAAELSEQLIDTFGRSSETLKLFIYYGAGFINMMLIASEIIAAVADTLLFFLDILSQTLTIITPFNVETAELAYTFGVLIGFLAAASRTVAFLSATYSALVGVGSTLKSLNIALSASTYQLSSSMGAAAVSATTLLLTLFSLVAVFYALTDIIRLLQGKETRVFDSWLTSILALTAGVYGLVKAFKNLAAIRGALAATEGASAAAGAANAASAAAYGVPVPGNSGAAASGASTGTTAATGVIATESLDDVFGTGGRAGPSRTARMKEQIVTAGDALRRKIVNAATLFYQYVILGAQKHLRNMFIGAYNWLGSVLSGSASWLTTVLSGSASWIASVLTSAAVWLAYILAGLAVLAGIAVVLAGIIGLLAIIAKALADVLGGGSSGGSSGTTKSTQSSSDGPDENAEFEVTDNGFMKKQNPFDVYVKGFGQKAKNLQKNNTRGGGRSQPLSDGGDGGGVKVEIQNDGVIGDKEFERMVQDQIDRKLKDVILQ